MNLVESSKMAMNLSDGQLSQALRAGTLPQFIVAAEMTRRRRTRDSGGGPQPTVVQELMTGANAIQPQQMPQAPPQMPQQMPQQMPPQGMRAGGPIRMSGQGPTQLVPQSEDPTYYMERMLKPPPLAIAPPPDAAAEDYLSSLLPELAKAKEKLTKSEKTQLTRALMEAGFAMMASKSPTLMGGIGEGGKAGMSAYAADKDRTQAGLMSLLQDEARVRTSQQSSADAAANRSQRNWEAGIYPQVAGHQGEVSQYMAANRAALEAGQYNMGAPDREMTRKYQQSQIDENAAQQKNAEYGGTPLSQFLRAVEKETGRKATAKEIADFEMMVPRLNAQTQRGMAEMYRVKPEDPRVAAARDETEKLAAMLFTEASRNPANRTKPRDVMIQEARAMALKQTATRFPPEVVQAISGNAPPAAQAPAATGEANYIPGRGFVKQ